MSWSVDPSGFAVEVEGAHSDLVVKIALEIDKSLVLSTPVDTGRARSNWMPSISYPSSDKGPPTSEAAAMARAASAFSEVPPFPALYLTNNLDYIQKLNDGWSKQAPANFVQLSIASVMSVF